MRHRRRPWLAVAFLIGFTSVALATVAQEAVLAALERDLELEQVFVATLRAIDDTTLAQILRGWGPGRAEEFLGRAPDEGRRRADRVTSAWWTGGGTHAVRWRLVDTEVQSKSSVRRAAP